MSARKSPVLCGNCKGYLGFKLSRREMEPVYCSACEPFVIHLEEEKQRVAERYKAAIRSTP